MKRFFIISFLLLCFSGPVFAETMTGKMLVASPDMRDPNFAETVVLISEHDQNCAFGLILNREMGRGPVLSLMKGLGIEPKEGSAEGAELPIRLHRGGPVEPGLGFILHGPGFKAANTVVINSSISMTANPDVVRAIAAGQGPKRYLMLLGYAGWAPGQLEGEIQRGGWDIIEADADIVLDANTKSKWKRARDKIQIRL